MRIPLLGGSYAARSPIANAQRCINYFPELNTKDSPSPTTHYQRPGFRPLVSGPSAPVRGLFQASNGNGYTVIGNQVFFVTPSFGLQNIGEIAPSGTNNPVSFVDNGTTGLLVDGTPLGGYTVVIGTNQFAKLNDLTGSFQGADRVDFLDGYILFNQQGSNIFRATLQNLISFDPLFFGQKAVWPDNLVSLLVCRREVIIFGTQKSEVWYDAGAAGFPFAIFPGIYIEHGVLARYSVANQDISTYWLGQNRQGRGIVFRHRGYETSRISNHALEYAIRQMSVKSDAIGFCHQLDGHTFYVLEFPTADQTWVFDEASAEWHQRAWTDRNGVLHRDRANCYANLYGLDVVGDWQNGTLYALDPNVYTDTVLNASGQPVVGPISCIRSFPHVMRGRDMASNQDLADSNGRLIEYTNFRADIDAGLAPISEANEPPQLSLRVSRDRGRTFESSQLQGAGQPGIYITQPQWRAHGLARDMIFELSHSLAGPASLNGAWIDAKVTMEVG